MENLISNQRKLNSKISLMTGNNESNSFFIATNIKKRLKVPVTKEIFLNLANLFHTIGIDRFSESIALKMVNAKSDKQDIKKIIDRTILNFN